MKLKAIQTALVVVLAVGIFGFGVYRYFPVIFGDTVYPLDYVDQINSCADNFGLDKPLLAALILKESGFNPRAVSRAGAMGLTQLMPLTAKGINQRVFDGKYSDYFDPETNICMGAAHLAGLMGTYNGDVTAALIAYNGGDGAARRYLAARDTSVLVTETRLYAPKILAAREAYASLYADKFTPPKAEFKMPDGTSSGSSGGSAFSTPTPIIKVEVQKQSDKTNAFWKGFIKDAFARFISK
ncbi:MAG: lytic transglycosylase domain-containing protein [Candidatus Berkelbacteria bacterium]|nr:lytic transglycosylase domain-containing protein [Candidatus Berkelbacteria bacterium]